MMRTFIQVAAFIVVCGGFFAALKWACDYDNARLREIYAAAAERAAKDEARSCCSRCGCAPR